MKIAIVTDAWHPQVNGVVRTYEHTRDQLQALGHEVHFITHEGFYTVPCPSYSSIRLAVAPRNGVARRLCDLSPDAIHIATEGPLGHAARAYCLKGNLPFTTSFHTRFPEYIRMRAPVPVAWSYAWLRRFHRPARRTLVPTRSQKLNLELWGFNNIGIWSRGVDTHLFRPRDRNSVERDRPVFAYMGRVAVEKNIEAFLRLELPGSKLVIGDGPDLKKLQRRYPRVHYTGFLFGEALATRLATADVFVFPSMTDTFGIVLLEAMACGLPVAAYPVTGPVDVVQQGITGVLDHDLRTAALAALELKPVDCIAYAHRHSWHRWTRVFLGHLAPVTAAGSPAMEPGAVSHRQ